MNLKKVLLVENDDDLINCYSEYLEMKGFKIVGKGHDGKEAVRLFIEKDPDIVFLNLIMPKYDGFFAMKGIKALNPRAKIIVSTEYQNDHKDELEKLKPSTILYKPFEVDDLLNSIEKVCM